MKRVRIRAGVFLGAVVVSCCAWLLFYSHAAVARAAAHVMDEEVERGNFSGAVLVSRGGRILFERAYGDADTGREIPNTTQTRFLIGSITKSFTAVLVMQFEQQRRLSLADPVCNYLETCPAGWQPIRLQHLLSHSSGIFNITNAPEFESLRGVGQTREQLLARMREHPLAFGAGERFAYSNSNYYLLGVVLEKISGDSYEHLLKRQVLDPLSMRDTGMARTADRTGQALGYHRDPAGDYRENPPMHESWSFSAGGMYSTLHDLRTFSDALADGRLLSRASLERMWHPVTGDYGYGFVASAVSQWTFDRRMVEHGGRMPGFVSMFQRYQDDGVTIIVLANRDDAMPPRVARGLGAAAFGVPYRSVFARRVVQVSTAVLERFAGVYEFEGTKFFLKIRNGGMVVNVEGGPEVPVSFESESAFFVEGMEGTVVALEDSKGAVTGLSVPIRGSMKVAHRVN
jgi:CubicO group peptidase (beta-lactamase class C family)